MRGSKKGLFGGSPARATMAQSPQVENVSSGMGPSRSSRIQPAYNGGRMGDGRTLSVTTGSFFFKWTTTFRPGPLGRQGRGALRPYVRASAGSAA